MKRKFAGFILGWMCCFGWFTTSFAQEVIGEGELELLSNARDKVSVDKIKLNKDGSYTLYAFSQLRDSAAFNGVGYLPALQVFKLDNKLELKSKVVESFDPDNPFAKINVSANEKSKEEKGKSYKDLLKIYPEFFQASDKPISYSYTVGNLVGKPVVIRAGVHYEYDPWSNSFTEIVKQKSIPIEMPVYEQGTFFIHDQIKVSEGAGLISFVLSNHQDVQNSFHLLYLGQTIVNCDLEGKQLSRYHLSFEYPSEIRYHQFLKDEKENSKGAVYIFGPARRFGFKMTDPDPHNYQIVMMNTKGERVFDHKFKYGVGGGASEPIYAVAHKEEVYVLGKGLGRNPDYHLFIFDKTGLKKVTLVDPEMLQLQTVGDSDVSIRKEHYSNFRPKGFVVTENGGKIFYGEHKSTVKNVTIDAYTKTKVPAVYEYPAYAFLHFDKDGNFMNNYSVEKNADCDELTTSDIHLLSSDAGKVRFWVTEKNIEEQLLQDHQKFYTARKGQSVNKNYVKQEETSALLSLDLETTHVKAFRVADGFVNIEGQKYYAYDAAKKELLLLGKPENQPGSSVKILFKKFRL